MSVSLQQQFLSKLLIELILLVIQGVDGGLHEGLYQRNSNGSTSVIPTDDIDAILEELKFVTHSYSTRIMSSGHSDRKMQ